MTGIFAFFESVPILRDAFREALFSYYQDQVNKAKAQRTEGFEEYAKAKTPDEFQSALGNIIRGRAK